jgi:hypothetical protein
MTLATNDEPVEERRKSWRSFALWLALFVVYNANGRSIESGDVVPATLIPVAIVRGDGPFLDRFGDLIRDEQGRWPGFAQESRGHGVSRYPIGPAQVATPLVAVQLIWQDVMHPGWEQNRAAVRTELSRMGKNAAAAIVALAAVVMFHVLIGMGLRKVALASVLIVALGTDDFAVASQGLWQHGPAELCLAVAWLMLLGAASGGVASGKRGQAPGPQGVLPGMQAAGRTVSQSPFSRRNRLMIAGASCALLVACRPTDLVFAVVIALWVCTRFDRAKRWAFALPAMLGAVALSIYHLIYFHTLTGGYAKIEQMHPWAHGVKGTWTTPFLQGASGTLFSPSHGLFIYAPWLLFALVLLPKTWSRLERGSLARWLIGALVPTFVILSKYSCWWAGHCFGPRFWIDANPIFAVILALALDWALVGKRWAWLSLFAVTAAFSIVIQMVGFLGYPSSWHGVPTNADRNHARLWHWRDNEVTRCWREGVKARMW